MGERWCSMPWPLPDDGRPVCPKVAPFQRSASMLDFWYQNAVLYELDVKTFQDSDGDGWGDFPGLTRRLPHVASLGATCLWLRPFYPSPLRDDGYDVTDFYAIDPRLGTFGAFVVSLPPARW